MNNFFTSDAFFALLILGVGLPIGVLALAFIAYLARMADNKINKNQGRKTK